jgi:hypothetical protein
MFPDTHEKELDSTDHQRRASSALQTSSKYALAIVRLTLVHFCILAGGHKKAQLPIN